MATTQKNPLLRIKPIDLIMKQSDDSEHGLKRTLGPVSITLLGIGAIVGTGIFVLTGVAAATYAGPGLILSFVVAGIVSGLAAICYAEFASTVPISGSAYTYSYATLGELIAWIIGWDLILEYAVGAAAVAIGWSGYLTDLLKSTFGITLPKALVASPFSGRIFFAMSRDGLLPRFFSRVHPRFRTPYLSSLLVGVVVALVAGLTPIDVVAELTNIGTLAAFVLVSAAVLVLRRTQPDLRRGFRTPWVPVIPILSVIASFVLIVSLPWITLVRFAVWLVIGLVIYFLYSQRRSHLQREPTGTSGEDIA